MKAFIGTAAAILAAFTAAPAAAQSTLEQDIGRVIRKQHACLAAAPGIGATAAMVQASCLPKVIGAPQKTRSVTARGVTEVWRFHTVRTVYFVDGIVAEIVDHPPR